jgi:hypothetical protein
LPWQRARLEVPAFAALTLGGPVDLVALSRTTPHRGNLAAAIAAFLDHADLATTTGSVYRACLATLVDGLEPVASAV